MNADFLAVLEFWEREKGIQRDVLTAAVQESLLSAAKKAIGPARELRVVIDQKNGDIRAYAKLIVSEKVVSNHDQITVFDARRIKPDAQVGEEVEKEVTPVGFGRIAAQYAKQALMQHNVLVEDFGGEVQAVEVRTAPAPPPQAAFEETEPMIEEPVAEEPMAEEPMAEEPVVEQAVEEPIEETPPPAPVAEPEAEMLPLEALAQEFQDFVPVCIQTFVDNDIFQVHEARPLCECTARESAAVGVDPATIARIAEALRADPSALSQDPQVQQAGPVGLDGQYRNGEEFPQQNGLDLAMTERLGVVYDSL